MSFAFAGAEILYSHLGGQGPLPPTGASSGKQGIRYVNVGVVFDPSGAAIYLDLVLTNRSAYTAHDPTKNVLSGKFAQINLKCSALARKRSPSARACLPRTRHARTMPFVWHSAILLVLQRWTAGPESDHAG